MPNGARTIRPQYGVFPILVEYFTLFEEDGGEKYGTQAQL